MKRFFIKLFGAIFCFGLLVLIFLSISKINEIFSQEYNFIVISVLFFFWVVVCSKLSSYIDKKFPASLKENYHKGIKVSITGVLTFFIYVFWLHFLIIMSFEGYFLKYFWVWFFIIISLCYLSSKLLYNLIFHKKDKLTLTLFLVLFFLVFAYTSLKIYDDTRPGVNVTQNTYDYRPFDGEKLTLLNKPANLKLNQNLPLLDGATALYPVYSAFASAVYDRLECILKDAVRLSTTKGAYEAIANKEVDMIFVAKPNDEQINKAKQNGVNLKFTPIGREAFVFFVSSKNSVNGLTSGQIREIYSGKIKRWSEVGEGFLYGDEILAYQRDKGSGSQSALENFMGEVRIMEPKKDEVVGLMSGIIEQVASYKNYKNAIGFSFRFYTQEMISGGDIKLLAIDGIKPTKENIKNGSYPLTSQIYAVTIDGEESPETTKFLEWILSNQGQEILEKVGYVGVN
ncbi:PstS family phosphate ABC transporter substrate-binding protein [Campylobacter corcagiensis]|uniref:Substrate-binding domain-containing protein n=1 Tax=Campylobacter corcagiensis TaxID=1448857 RepID=A0A7M1LGH0_9BACT|nr:substrate-binding domain-containing protein [Campylobacter corcagiensis]QKF64874.1 phosphate ABC transporter, periplasmic phosphate-binding protein [Campylobacter corcagiensis]QOQ86966.1 substrate-binding domain-containing protein [Campylobacter corcagiensis]